MIVTVYGPEEPGGKAYDTVKDRFKIPFSPVEIRLYGDEIGFVREDGSELNAIDIDGSLQIEGVLRSENAG